MNRIKRLLLAGGGAALLMAVAVLIASPTPATAALTSGPPVEDCTFCSAYLRSCGVWDVYATCYRKMSGPGTCPPCGQCRKMYRDE